TNDAPATFPIGDTTVTWTSTDAAGNTATCTQVVTVVDNINPTISACPSAVTVNVDAGTCTASGVSLGAAPTGTDNCGVPTITNDAPATFPIGDTTVTWTSTDAAGNTATCTQVVTVISIVEIKNDVGVTNEDISVNIDVLNNDSSDCKPLVVSSVSNAANGNVLINGDGTVTYTPNVGFTGTDTFTYVVTVKNPDGSETTETATVTVTVTDEGTPVAAADPTAATTSEDTSVTTGNVLTNDTVVDGATITSFDAVSTNGGSVTSNGDGTFVYSPATGFVGTDSFTYTLCDDDTPTPSCSTATVTVTVTDEGTPVAAADPTAATTSEDTSVTTGNVLTNDTVVDGATITSFDAVSTNGGSVTSNGDGTFVYSPATGFVGTDSFTYTLCDDDTPTPSCST
ncbi:Ig-like domain-containing protein, partial [Tenacibaculum adriaticum]|uniref:Ig-like domain-containing protein n=1 Tax=Tenacibaculum adriaticum TaxID=413713 RepID=UPI0011E69E7E